MIEECAQYGSYYTAKAVEKWHWRADYVTLKKVKKRSTRIAVTDSGSFFTFR